MSIGGSITLPSASDAYSGSMTVGGYVPDTIAEEAVRSINGADAVAAYQPDASSLDGLAELVANAPEGGVADLDPRTLAANHLALGNAILGHTPDGTNATDHGLPWPYVNFVNHEPGLTFDG
jgi:hypothetical protein